MPTFVEARTSSNILLPISTMIKIRAGSKMKLYSGTSYQFIDDTIQNQIAEKLKASFFLHFRYNPSDSEVNSWRNSLRAISQIFQYSNLDHDNGIFLEYQLPINSQRLDCMITGKNATGQENAVIIELKQWDRCEESNGLNEVVTWVAGSKKDLLHPSIQVGQYRLYLQDLLKAFYEDNPIELSACAYLHNYNYYTDDVIFADKFSESLRKYPLFTGDDVLKLKDFLQSKVGLGDGMENLNRIEHSKYRPSKKLMDHVGNTIKGKSEYIFLDKQQIIYDKIFAFARDGFHDKQKQVVIIKGGPGTGKSVIALNLMADLLLNGYNAHYATGSKAFTETLREIIGRRGGIQFKYFNSYTNAKANEIDVLICDEAHRIRKNSNSRFTKKEYRSNLPQIAEIINASKVSVFFIDDNQVVRPDEIGSVSYIAKFALENNCKIYFEELDAQFRCNGSDGFINWINNTLSIKKTANILWDSDDDFEFKIFNSPVDLDNAIKEKVGEGHSARLTAGFCWKWSDQQQDGSLVEDVVVGDFKRPWNAKPGARLLDRNIPASSLWAYDPLGINQVGCVYTAQGFEFIM
nr:DNA/RNA helicase domain-containing protein [Paenibacillus cellulositrophicus]